MGPKVQFGKVDGTKSPVWQSRWDQKSSLAKMAWDQLSEGSIVWLPFEVANVSLIALSLYSNLLMMAMHSQV